jgi:hypothetical protein
MKAMILNIELALATYAVGRVMFHIICVFRDCRHYRFHFAGIAREFKR